MPRPWSVAWPSGGVRALSDARIENIETMRRAGVQGSMILLRTPMPSQATRVVEHADTSFNTELAVVSALSSAAGAAGRTHGVVLMVDG
jgi:predicted amino acid racemase